MDVNILIVSHAVAFAELTNAQQILQRVSKLYADVYGLDQQEILEGLEQREVLGSTGFGRGVAIPHCRNSAVSRPTMVVLRLAQPVDFNSVDALPVSVVFALVSPENAGATHLHALAAVSRMVRDDTMLDAILDAPDPDALFGVLTNQFLRDAA